MFFEKELEKKLIELGVTGEIIFTAPPKTEMGDLAFACFGFAKEKGKSPVEVAKELAEKISLAKLEIITEVKVFGPYINFYVNPHSLVGNVLAGKKEKNKVKKGKIMVEFAHPNTHKPVHIGHLRNMITGESLVRLFESQGYKVVRANYQGDVGMHIAKCLWGIMQDKNWQAEIKKLKTVAERAKFLGKVYAIGGQAYEKDESAKKEIEEINAKIYAQDKLVKALYKKTRQWSLDYFDYIYKRVGIKKFDRLYFESETFELGKKIVLAGVKSGVFKESEGAIIFEGSKYNLHDRVFVNSKGLPTYEAKDQALAQLQFKEYRPEAIYHVVGKEQIEYFKVIFKALEFVLPESKDKENHLVYGWVSLKEGKMSSRTGNVVLAEWLVDETEKHISEIMKDREMKNKETIIKKIANAAVKYSMLKTGVVNDIVFDFNESVSLSGNSGPYLLYIVARINSILKKIKIGKVKLKIDEVKHIESQEKCLMLELAKFDGMVVSAAEGKDPSRIAHYLFGLAQAFNNFYQVCPVLETEKNVQAFRVQLINQVKAVMEKGLYLLGIETIESM